MRNLFLGAFIASVLMFTNTAMAQETVWVQVAAKRSLAEAELSAREFAATQSNVNGFVMNSGWYAIALGPFLRPDADIALNRLRATGQIPFDSYIAFPGGYRRQFWPVGSVLVPDVPVSPGTQITQATPEPVVQQPIFAADETAQQARQSERNLSRQEREQIQSALKWEGVYNSGIDGAFGPGTRRAMADWQTAQNYEATGVLTTMQRLELVEGYKAVLASIGMELVVDTVAGIEIDLPMALVEFDRYQPPFAHYVPVKDSGVQVSLISQTGDETTLRGLYDILQTLEVIPLDGPRSIRKGSFTLTGQNDEISSYSFATVTNGQVKGFILTWPAGEERKRDVVLAAMRNGFQTWPDAVLPDVFGDPEAVQSLDLMAGLEIRRPDVSRSGFYVGTDGTVLTTNEVVAPCTRITLDGDFEADLVATDTVSGLALLRPRESLVPIERASFLSTGPRLNSEIAISGYSYEGILGSPTLTYGTLADIKGLRGEPWIIRLSLGTTPGDAGGPVFDAHGAVQGMLLSKAASNRKLPEDVNFAVDTAGIVDFLSANGVSATASDAAEMMEPEDLTIRAANMTVLVSCWN